MCTARCAAAEGPRPSRAEPSQTEVEPRASGAEGRMAMSVPQRSRSWTSLSGLPPGRLIRSRTPPYLLLVPYTCLTCLSKVEAGTNPLSTPTTSRRPCLASARRSERPACMDSTGRLGLYSGVLFGKKWAMGDRAVVACQTALRLCPLIHDSASRNVYHWHWHPGVHVVGGTLAVLIYEPI